MNWWNRLLGRHEPAPEVLAAREKQEQDFQELEDAVDVARAGTAEVNRLTNGIIRDYEEAEKGIKGRP